LPFSVLYATRGQLTELRQADLGFTPGRVATFLNADISGVLFTADLVTGSHMSMTGNEFLGFGEELVSGEAEPYTLTLERPKGRYDGPAELRRFARKLHKLTIRLEKELGCPQDIE